MMSMDLRALVLSCIFMSCAGVMQYTGAEEFAVDMVLNISIATYLVSLLLPLTWPGGWL